MSRFDEVYKMKLGDILKTFTTSTFAMDTTIEAAIGEASPIWVVLGITEEEYYIRYPPVDVSGNEVAVETPVDVSDNEVAVETPVDVSDNEVAVETPPEETEE